MSHAVFGIVRTRDDAGDLLSALVAEGFAASDVSILLQMDPRDRSLGTGVVVGGVLGMLASMAAFVVSGLGPIVVAGPLVRAFATADCAAEGLVRLGIEERRARQYESSLQDGGVLVSVRAAPHEVALATLVFAAGGAEVIAAVSALEADERISCSAPEASSPRLR